MASITPIKKERTSSKHSFGSRMDNAGAETVYKLFKLFSSKKKTPIDQTTAESLKLLSGKACLIKKTSYKGVIIGPNMENSGFCPGSEFPVLVKITSVGDKRFIDSLGCVFEYEMDDIILI